MPEARRFDPLVFVVILVGVLAGMGSGLALQRWFIPEVGSVRLTVLSTVVVPLGCFLGWLLSPSRERLATAGMACFGLYLLSAFVAARLGTLVPRWEYFRTVLWVQTVGGIALAALVAGVGRASVRVEGFRRAGDGAGLLEVLRQGEVHERREAVRALADLGGASARAALLQALGDPAVQVRREAASALVGVAGEGDVPVLRAALEDPDALVRRRALEAISWIEGEEAQAAIAAYWARFLEHRAVCWWLLSTPLIAGAVALMAALLLPWRAGTQGGEFLWSLSGGTAVALLLAGSSLLAPAELLWGTGRRNMAGHLERLRLWVFMPSGVLAIALLWPLRAPAAWPQQGWAFLGAGFWVAGVGAMLQIVGGFVLHG